MLGWDQIKLDNRAIPGLGQRSVYVLLFRRMTGRPSRYGRILRAKLDCSFGCVLSKIASLFYFYCVPFPKDSSSHELREM